MRLPPAYRKPHSMRYWTGLSAAYGVFIVTLIVFGLLGRPFMFVFAGIASITLAFCLLALREQHGARSGSRGDVEP